MKGSFDSAKHIYRIDGHIVPSNTEILAMAGLVDMRWYTEEGRDRGTAVHFACQLIDEDDLNWSTVSEAIESYVRAYEKFKLESGFEPTLIEVPHYNYPHRYGTTIDRIGILPNRGEVLLELKSGAVEDWAGLQLALQNECLSKRLPRFALQLKPDGNYRLDEFKDPNDRNVALSACAVVHWKRNHGGIDYGKQHSNAA